MGQVRLRQGSPVSTAKRRGNHEGTVPRLRPDGRWQIDLRYLSNGVGQRTTVYGTTQGQARAKAKALRQRLELGQPARDTTDTVGTFALEWITTALAASERKASTKAMYAALTRNHIASSALGGMPLSKATPRAVEGWLVELRARGLAESTVRIAYDILLAILETAVRDGALGRNPAVAVKRPTVTRHEASYLTPDQVRAVLSAAGGTRYAPLFTLLVNTGLRRGEALALQWSDVDLRLALCECVARWPESMASLRSRSQRRQSLSAPCRSLRLPCGLSTPCVQSKLRSVSGPALGGIRPALCSSLSLVSHASHVTLCGLLRRPPSVLDYRARWACTRCATLQLQ